MLEFPDLASALRPNAISSSPRWELPFLPAVCILALIARLWRYHSPKSTAQEPGQPASVGSVPTSISITASRIATKTSRNGIVLNGLNTISLDPGMSRADLSRLLAISNEDIFSSVTSFTASSGNSFVYLPYGIPFILTPPSFYFTQLWCPFSPSYLTLSYLSKFRVPPQDTGRRRPPATHTSPCETHLP